MAKAKQRAKKKKPSGRPFKKGESGNPGGRPKLTLEQRQERAQAQAVIDANTSSAAWTLVELLEHPDPKERRMAADSILEKASITGVSRLQLTGADGGPVQWDLKLLSDDQLRKLRELTAIVERKALPP